MIFHETYQKVLDGTKTQTRRPIKENHRVIFSNDNALQRVEVCNLLNLLNLKPKWRCLWEISRTYAIQSGRGKKSLGRIKLLKIRLEHVQSISCSDLIAEGLNTNLRRIDATMDLLRQWEELWDSLYKGTEFAYEKKPRVWVLEFELVEKY